MHQQTGDLISAPTIIPRNLVKVLIYAAILLGLYLISRYNYLLFHSLAELFSILIAGTIFILAWNFRRFYTDSFLLFIGIAYLCFGFIDLAHTLAYKGMGIFQGDDANLPTQLWIASRYMQSISLLLAPFFIRRGVKSTWLLSAYAAVTALLLLSIFAWKIFPLCYIEGSGLTPFKIISEYVINLILAAAIVFLVQSRHVLDRRLLGLLILSIVCTMVSELSFTFYISVYDLSNLVGHFFKIAAFYLIYLAIIETASSSIYTDMTQLRQTEKALRESETLYRTIVRSIPNSGVTVFDHDLRFSAVEGMVYSQANQSSIIRKGSLIREVLNADSIPFIEDRCRSALAGVATSYETQYNGRVYWSQYVPLHDETGRVSAGMAITLDITERHNLEEQTREDAARIDVQRRLIEQREQERLRIAQDLHDSPVQTLAAAMYTLQDLAVECQNPQIAARLETIHALIKDAVDDLREYAQELRPPILFNIGLKRAFETQLETFHAKHPQLKIHQALTREKEGLSEQTRITLFRVFQESLHNIIKHAQATDIWVKFTQDETQIHLEIQDNGVGFEMPADVLTLAREGHLGLLGMRERVEAIGGTMEIISHPGEGTRIQVHISPGVRSL